MFDPAFPSAIDQLRRNWGWFLALGVALIVLGTIALGYTVLFTVLAVVFFGILLMVSGVAQLVNAIMARHWSGVFLHLLAGVLEFMVGLLIVTHPLPTAEVMTLLLAALFLVGGVFRMVGSVLLRFPNWGWALLGGFITFLLGILLWRQWPLSGLWFLGLCLAIDLLLHGWSWLFFALALRRPSHGPV